MSTSPTIFTTLGDAGGIGPELVARSLENPDTTRDITRLIVGPESLFQQGCEIANTNIDIPVFDNAESAIASKAKIALVDCNRSNFSGCEVGESSESAGCVDLAIGKMAADLYKAGMIDGFVFAPVNKLSLKMAGSKFEGYKAYIADYLGVKATAAEINTIGDLWTTRVSSHVPISEVPSFVKQENVLNIIEYFDRELKRFGYQHPKIAVSGLNPHNGDGGMFGREEIDEIAPAVEQAKARQLNVDGPFPPDTVFLTTQSEHYLGVVSMYHDQCQIATKLLGFDEGVTYFGGLPFPITTPAHGTAYDIAGQGKASVTPFNNALALMRRAVLTAKGLPL